MSAIRGGAAVVLTTSVVTAGFSSGIFAYNMGHGVQTPTMENGAVTFAAITTGAASFATLACTMKF